MTPKFKTSYSAGDMPALAKQKHSNWAKDLGRGASGYSATDGIKKPNKKSHVDGHPHTPRVSAQGAGAGGWASFFAPVLRLSGQFLTLGKR